MSSEADLVWKALADPTRRAILDLLAKAPLTTGDLCEHFGLARHGGIGRTGVMKHVDVLHRAGLVLFRREGRQRWNYVNAVPIQRVCDRWVSGHVRDLARSANHLKDLAEGKRRPLGSG
ncbi:MAG: winged helix-turn-helix transcriptional regulator [bacterium]|nr:winged helix-turn-helix transcriptional regulator [bacterium]